MPLELRFLPAAEGDAIWVRWGDQHVHQMLVDMGPQSCGPIIRTCIERLDPVRRHFDLLVITHVDGDHIGGVLSGVAEAPSLDGLAFDDIWFNGWAHLNGAKVPAPGIDPGPEAMGAAQGERLTSWLTGAWNEEFERGPVARENPLRRVKLPGGMRVTILGPTTDRLKALRATWEREVERAIAKGDLPALAGRESMRAKPVRPNLASKLDLKRLADAYAPADDSPSNRTSITMLLEWRGRRVLLTGDALGSDVLAGLRMLGEDPPIQIDVVKLPHHGSAKNVTSELVKTIKSANWVFSSSGAKHYHPDATAVARVVLHSAQPQLLFNVPSEFNQWWCDDTWKDRFGYTTDTGGRADGITFVLEPVE
jgi:hypothetical protein